MKAKIPLHESARLESLRQYDILDTLPEQVYDDITLLASVVCDTPIALVSLVDAERQWFKSSHGLDALETAREFSFCAHAILEPEHVFVVPDARIDQRFSSNPLVTGAPHIQFYAGAPLMTPQGYPLGTICVIDQAARPSLSRRQLEAMHALSRQVMTQLEFHRQSLTDGLTKVRNRRAFDEILPLELERARRAGQPVSILMMDVDFFKSFNDEYGHPAGDELLQILAKTLKATARSTDCVARYGGEEFVVLLPNTDMEGASIMAERFRHETQKMQVAPILVTISVGVSSINFSQAQQDFDGKMLLAAADRALYRAKNNGRNQVACESSLRPV